MQPEKGFQQCAFSPKKTTKKELLAAEYGVFWRQNEKK